MRTSGNIKWEMGLLKNKIIPVFEARVKDWSRILEKALKPENSEYYNPQSIERYKNLIAESQNNLNESRARLPSLEQAYLEALHREEVHAQPPAA